jgi:Astacin (Peptidase family M12A)
MRKILLCLALATAARGMAQVQVCVPAPARPAPAHRGANGVYESFSLWKPGDTITVSFLNTDFPDFGTIAAHVRQDVKEWEQYANIHFRFQPYSSQTEVLIELAADGASWSTVGRSCVDNARQHEASMHYGWFNKNTSDEEFKRVILHEFGHTLGLCHEHQNPLGDIHWNKPAVYGYYCEKQQPPWPVKQVDEEVFSKLTNGVSNKKYDPQSIMHYPIPKEFTTDGFYVGWNVDLSAGDKSIVAELYPGAQKKAGGAEASSAIETKKSLGAGLTAMTASFDSISISHNITDSLGRVGMLIHPYFSIRNSKGKNCSVVGYFQNAISGKPLKSHDDQFADKGGRVAVWKDFSPLTDNSRFEHFTLFIPYTELETGDGEHHLRFVMRIWSDKDSLSRSGFTNFTYSQGPTCSSLVLRSTLTGENRRLVIHPGFSLKNAGGTPYQVVAYFMQGDDYIKDSAGGILSFQTAFNPDPALAYYNTDPSKADLSIYVDIARLHLSANASKLRFFVNLNRVTVSGDTTLAVSGWNDLYIDPSGLSASTIATASVGVFRIRNVTSNSYILQQQGSLTCGAAELGSPGGNWNLVAMNDATNHFYVMTAGNFGYLSVTDGRLTIQQERNTGSDWILEKMSEPTNAFRIRNAGTGYCLYDYGMAPGIAPWSERSNKGTWFFEKL